MDQILSCIQSNNQVIPNVQKPSPKAGKIIPCPPPPKEIRPGSYESINFGPPPDDDFDDFL